MGAEADRCRRRPARAANAPAARPLAPGARGVTAPPALSAASVLSGGSEKTRAVVRSCGCAIDPRRRAELRHAPFAEGRGVAAEEQRLLRLRRGVDEDRARGREDARQFLAQLLAQLVVEVGERLVEQHEIGAA